jgi:hypothetical protein
LVEGFTVDFLVHPLVISNVIEEVALALAMKKASILENYFVSSRNSSDPGPLQIPFARKRPCSISSLEVSTSCTKGDDCINPKRANIAVQLICLGGLPLAPEVVVEGILNGVEIINVTDDDKAAGTNQKKRSYEVSRRC